MKFHTIFRASAVAFATSKAAEQTGLQRTEDPTLRQEAVDAGGADLQPDQLLRNSKQKFDLQLIKSVNNNPEDVGTIKQGFCAGLSVLTLNAVKQKNMVSLMLNLATLIRGDVAPEFARLLVDTQRVYRGNMHGSDVFNYEGFVTKKLLESMTDDSALILLNTNHAVAVYRVSEDAYRVFDSKYINFMAFSISTNDVLDWCKSFGLFQAYSDRGKDITIEDYRTQLEQVEDPCLKMDSFYTLENALEYRHQILDQSPHLFDEVPNIRCQSTVAVNGELFILQGNGGFPFLNTAVYQNDTKLVKQLLKTGNPQLDTLGKYGESPLELAVQNKNNELLGQLLKAKADPSAHSSIALFRAARINDPIALRQLIEAKGDVNQALIHGDKTNPQKMSLLELATIAKADDVVITLITEAMAESNL